MYGPGASESGDSLPVPPHGQPRRGQRRRAPQGIAAQVRALIHDGRLRPGDRLPPERELCERYRVSRVTVREALRVLEASGLVTIKVGSRGGTFVSAPSHAHLARALEDYLTLCPAEDNELRRALETAAGLIARDHASPPANPVWPPVGGPPGGRRTPPLLPDRAGHTLYYSRSSS